MRAGSPSFACSSRAHAPVLVGLCALLLTFAACSSEESGPPDRTFNPGGTFTVDGSGTVDTGGDEPDAVEDTGVADSAVDTEEDLDVVGDTVADTEGDTVADTEEDTGVDTVEDVQEEDIPGTPPIEVTVYGLDGEPVQSARVVFQSTEGEFLGQTLTDETGVAEFTVEETARVTAAIWSEGGRDLPILFTVYEAEPGDSLTFRAAFGRGGDDPPTLGIAEIAVTTDANYPDYRLYTGCESDDFGHVGDYVADFRFTERCVDDDGLGNAVVVRSGAADPETNPPGYAFVHDIAFSTVPCGDADADPICEEGSTCFNLPDELGFCVPDDSAVAVGDWTEYTEFYPAIVTDSTLTNDLEFEINFLIDDIEYTEIWDPDAQTDDFGVPGRGLDPWLMPDAFYDRFAVNATFEEASSDEGVNIYWTQLSAIPERTANCFDVTDPDEEDLYSYCIHYQDDLLPRVLNAEVVPNEELEQINLTWGATADLSDTDGVYVYFDWGDPEEGPGTTNGGTWIMVLPPDAESPLRLPALPENLVHWTPNYTSDFAISFLLFMEADYLDGYADFRQLDHLGGAFGTLDVRDDFVLRATGHLGGER